MNSIANLKFLLIKFQLLLQSAFLVIGVDEWNYKELSDTTRWKRSASDIVRSKRDDSGSIAGIEEVKTDFKAKYSDMIHEEYGKSFAPVDINKWNFEAVDMHNKIRMQIHGNPVKLKLDWALSCEAFQWAVELGRLSFESNQIILHHNHNNTRIQGENLGGRRLGSREQLDSLPGSFPVRIWYSEIANRDWSTTYYQHTSGHFSQVVWSASKYIGCGKYITKEDCSGSDVKKRPILIMVCRYHPPGNYVGRFGESAFKSHVHKPVSGDPNAVPDFSKLCPSGSEPCKKPYVCCSTTNSPATKNFKPVCSQQAGRGFGNSSIIASKKTSPKIVIHSANDEIHNLPRGIIAETDS